MKYTRTKTNDIRVEKVVGVYRIIHPSIANQIACKIDKAFDLIDRGRYKRAMQIAHTVIDRCPNCIEGYDILASCLLHRGESNVALATFEKAINLVLQAFPSDVPRDKVILDHHWFPNGRFLVIYNSLGIAYFNCGYMDRALETFIAILKLDPYEERLTRTWALRSCFELNRPKDVIEICQQFPKDSPEETLFCCLLAYYQLGNEVKTQELLEKAIESYPFIVRELLKRKHEYQREGGFSDEEFRVLDYCWWFSRCWRRTKDARKFVRSAFSRHELISRFKLSNINK